jgi:hypothetical protein
MAPAAPGAGPALPSTPVAAGDLEPLIARAVEWLLARAGAGSTRAVLLSGSAASGPAVWASTAVGPRMLSDLDLFVVVADEVVARRARATMRAGLGELRAALREVGLWAPVDAGFYTPADLERLPARPATLELAARARAVWGDASWLARVPRFQPSTIDHEERLLLLENRGQELLLARALLARGDEEGEWRAAHATHKSALDLATVLLLRSGAWHPDPAQRVADAGAALAPGSMLVARAPALAELWGRALEWRRAPRLAAGEAHRAWEDCVQAWCAIWLELCAGGPAGEPDPYRWVEHVAARARWRRRLRQSASPPRAQGDPRPLPRVSLVLTARAGTPRHRLNGCAAALLFATAETRPGPPALGPRAARSLRRLAPLRPPADSDWEAWSDAVVRAWDGWYLDGQRTAELP